jgi:hypothetical protein
LLSRPNIDRKGFEVLTAVVMNIIFWNITPCSPLKVNRRFGGIYRLNLRGRIRRLGNQREGRQQAEPCFDAGFLYGLFDSVNKGDVLLRNVG